MMNKNKYNSPSLLKDTVFGLNNEKNVILKLRNYFQEDIIKSNFKYSTYDAKCSDTNTLYEIKTRRCCYKTYKTTIIPIKKIENANICNTLYFIFAFTDGIYFVKYNKTLFETFDKEFITYCRDGVIVKPVEHICIPCKYLTLLVEK